MDLLKRFMLLILNVYTHLWIKWIEKGWYFDFMMIIIWTPSIWGALGELKWNERLFVKLCSNVGVGGD